MKDAGICPFREIGYERCERGHCALWVDAAINKKEWADCSIKILAITSLAQLANGPSITITEVKK